MGTIWILSTLSTHAVGFRGLAVRCGGVNVKGGRGCSLRLGQAGIHKAGLGVCSEKKRYCWLSLDLFKYLKMGAVH